MIFGISGTKRTFRNREVSVRLDGNIYSIFLNSPRAVAMATADSHTSTMTLGEGEKSTVVHIEVTPQQQQQAMVSKPLEAASMEDAGGTVNSSRWSDTETMTLLSLWRANYRLIKGKKRNYQEWNMIAREFNRRVAHCSLGPRTGNQCKVRIKNLLAEYNRTKDQLPHSFPYHDILKEIIANKGAPFNHDDVVRINIPLEMCDAGMSSATVVTASPAASLITLPSDNTTPKVLRPIAPAPPITPLNAPIANHVGQVQMQVYTEGTTPTPGVTASQNAPSDEESSEEDSPLEETPVSGVKRPHWHNTLSDFLPTRKKPRKNPRPVKMTQSRQEDFSMIAILREFLEDSRKREEDLFKRILQQQLEAESRYQQFTLDVLKEIGKMFKKE